TVMIHIFTCFFFSSRRRHTRSKRDWSSDVCSSDLIHPAALVVVAVAVSFAVAEVLGAAVMAVTQVLRHRERAAFADVLPGGLDRSEERRVGKEWRSRWSADH